MKKVFNGRFINSSLARYKMATCLQILQIKKRLEQLLNKPNESFNCAIIRKVFSTALSQAPDISPDLWSWNWFTGLEMSTCERVDTFFRQRCGITLGVQPWAIAPKL